MMKFSIALSLILTIAGCSAAPGALSSPVSSAVSPSASANASAAPSAFVAPTISPTTVPLPNFAQLSAPSRGALWVLVAGSLLFRSTDRGDTSEQRPLPSTLNTEISFVDDHEGWLSSVGSPATGCQSQDIGVWHTRDAGTTWERLSPNGIGASGCKSELSFFDTTHGFLAASDAYHAPVIYRTIDGGRSWNASRPLSDPPGYVSTPDAGVTLRVGRVLSFGSTLLVAAQGTKDGGSVSYVFRSIDGGASWSYLATAPQPGCCVVIVSASRWLEGPLGQKETTDAGDTWHALASDYSQGAGVQPDVIFADAQTGYATVRGGIQRTIDGGAHWKYIHTPGT